MKNIYTIIIGVLLLTLSSCNTDDAAFPVTINETVDITATLTTVASISSPGEDLGFNVTLPQAFSESSRVTIQALVGDIYESTTVVTIPPGELTANGIITMPSAGPILLGEENASEVSVKGLRLVTITTNGDGEEVITDSENDNFNLTSNVVDVDLLALVGVNLSIDWTGDASVDVDFALINLDTFDFPAGDVIGATVSKPEVLSIENSNAALIDGNYAILYRSYSDTTGPVDFTANIYDSSGTTVNTYAITAANVEDPLVVSGNWFLANTFLNAIRVTDANGTVTWTFTLP